MVDRENILVRVSVGVTKIRGQSDERHSGYFASGGRVDTLGLLTRAMECLERRPKRWVCHLRGFELGKSCVGGAGSPRGPDVDAYGVDERAFRVRSARLLRDCAREVAVETSGVGRSGLRRYGRRGPGRWCERPARVVGALRSRALCEAIHGGLRGVRAFGAGRRRRRARIFIATMRAREDARRGALLDVGRWRRVWS